MDDGVTQQGGSGLKESRGRSCWLWMLFLAHRFHDDCSRYLLLASSNHFNTSEIGVAVSPKHLRLELRFPRTVTDVVSVCRASCSSWWQRNHPPPCGAHCTSSRCRRHSLSRTSCSLHLRTGASPSASRSPGSPTGYRMETRPLLSGLERAKAWMRDFGRWATQTTLQLLSTRA